MLAVYNYYVQNFRTHCLFAEYPIPHQDVRLTRWAHETLVNVLNIDLLPVYLDVLQVIKAKVVSLSSL